MTFETQTETNWLTFGRDPDYI